MVETPTAASEKSASQGYTFSRARQPAGPGDAAICRRSMESWDVRNAGWATR